LEFGQEVLGPHTATVQLRPHGDHRLTRNGRLDQTRLAGQRRADEEFAAYGLSEAEILDLKSWAQSWADDINQRIYRDAADEEELP
jgi:hypothetical protein